MAGDLRETLWGSECKDTTADTGIATSGLGPMRIFPAPTGVRAHCKRAQGKRKRAHSKPWYTKCHSGWSFAKRCSGMRGRRTNSGICKRSEESQMNWGGIFVVPRRMDSDWKELSMALGRASIVLPT